MKLKGKKIAILVEDFYNELELWYPYYRLLEEGAEVKLVGPTAKIYESKHGLPAEADLSAADVKAGDFQGIIVPPAILSIVRGVFEKGGLVSSICHGGWVLISAGIIKGKRATCTSAIKDDLINAGATYLDQEVVVDGNLVTSRSPQDLPSFLPAIITALQNK